MNRYWFKPKKFGYGASPSTWEGWALGVIYVVGLVVASIALVPFGRAVSSGRIATWIVIVTAATAATFLIAYRKTDGPWRWRWQKRNAPRDT